MGEGEPHSAGIWMDLDKFVSMNELPCVCVCKGRKTESNTEREKEKRDKKKQITNESHKN